MGSRGGEAVPALDGWGVNFLDLYHEVHLWARATHTELTARASLLVLHMQPAPRQVCLAEGSDISAHGDGASQILNISRNYFAPEAAMRFTNK